MDFQKIVEIANRSKDLSGGQDYALANAAFAVLLQEYFYGAGGLGLELETNDEGGESVSETFYDVVGIKAGESSLCIPLPLLEPCTIAAVVKRAQFIPRGEHRRTYKDGLTEEKAALWAELFAEVGTDRLIEALSYLTEDTGRTVKTFIPEAA